MTLAEAVDELAERIDAREFPEVPDATLTKILQRCAYVKVFTPSMVVGAGQLILPSSASLSSPGAAYITQVPGIAGSEPTWPTAAGSTADSGSVRFAWWGVYDGIPWDMNEATRQALKQKIAACAKLVDSASPGQKRSYSQMLKGYREALAALGPASRGYA